MSEQIKKYIIETHKKGYPFEQIVDLLVNKYGYDILLISDLIQQCKEEIDPFLALKCLKENIDCSKKEIEERFEKIENSIEQMKNGSNISSAYSQNIYKEIKRVELEVMKQMLDISITLRQEINELLENNDKRYLKRFNTKIELQKVRTL